jgi:putative addiction module component (TIGR02574 family)
VDAENLTKISLEHLGLSSPRISCIEFPMIAIAEIHELPLHEKLRMMEVLWDGIAPLEAELEVPQWHKDLLDEREQLILDGKAKFIDWETAKLQIKDATS